MRLKLYYYIWSLLPIIGSCDTLFNSEENDEYVDLAALNRDPIWESEQLYIQGTELQDGGHSLYRHPISGGTVAVGYSDQDGSKYLIGLDMLTGKRAWTSDYRYLGYSGSLVNEWFAFQVGSSYYYYGTERVGDTFISPFFHYNIETGALIDRKLWPQKFLGNPTMVEHRNGYIASLSVNEKDPNKGIKEPKFYINTTHDLDNRFVLEVPRKYSNQVYEGGGSDISGFLLLDDRGETFLFYILNESQSDIKSDVPHAYHYTINCYNISKHKWVYNRLDCNVGDSILVTDGDIVYAGSSNYNDPDKYNERSGLQAIRWKTGELVWERRPTYFHSEYNYPFDAIGLAYHDGVIVFSSITYAYGVNATNGEVLWKVGGIGNSNSPWAFHHGVAYSTSSDGLLYGWDLRTGELLLRAECPSEGREIYGNRIPGFQADIGLYVDDNDKGYLFASNYVYGYAFEAVR